MSSQWSKKKSNSDRLECVENRMNGIPVGPYIDDLMYLIPSLEKMLFAEVFLYYWVCLFGTGKRIENFLHESNSCTKMHSILVWLDGKLYGRK